MVGGMEWKRERDRTKMMGGGSRGKKEKGKGRGGREGKEAVEEMREG